ncbi:MAG: hypothetical protein AAFZ15_34345 [Bacteroidota bacterium]
MFKTKSTAQFISDAKRVHGNRYSYRLTDYKRSTLKVVITCKVHGNFEQTPNSHLKGSGCPECGKLKKLDTLAAKREKLAQRKFKRCSKCGEEKKISEFATDNRKPGGKGSWCLECKRDNDNERIKTYCHTEDYKKKRRQWEDNNRERINEYYRNYYHRKKKTTGG